MGAAECKRKMMREMGEKQEAEGKGRKVDGWVRT